MSKAKNLKQKILEDSDDASDSPLPIIAPKASKKQQVQAKKVSKIPPKPESDQEEDTPVVEKPKKQVKTQVVVAKKPVAVAKKVAKKQSSEEQSEEEQPKKVTKAKSPVQKAVVPPKKVAKKQSSEEEESSEQKPKKVVKAKSPLQKPAVPAKKVVKQSSQQSESEEVAPVKAKGKPVPKAASPALKAKSPVQKPLPTKKPVKPETSSEQESEQVAPVKALQKGKSPVQKALTPKPKSPAQKAVVPAKKVVQESEEESEEEEKPKKVVAKKPVAKVSSSDESQEQKPAKKVVQVKGKAAKKVEQSEEEQEQLEAPKNVKKFEAPKQHADAAQIDQEGEFQVCVKGLSFQAFQSDIEELFNPFGNVISVRLLTREDGKSKGLAFVKFSSKASFNKALELNGTEQFGRAIVVEQSLGKQNNNGGFQKGGNFGNNNRSFGGNNNKQYPTANATIETPTLFIGGLSYNSTRESISDYFSKVGEVASARIVTDKQTGKPRGFGYVEFHDVDTAKKAYQSLNNGMLDGRQIRLDSAAQRDRPQGGFGGGSFGGGFGGAPRGAPRSSNVNLSQDDKNAKKGSITQFQGKLQAL